MELTNTQGPPGPDDDNHLYCLLILTGTPSKHAWVVQPEKPEECLVASCGQEQINAGAGKVSID
jgi:hypothetical protein